MNAATPWLVAAVFFLLTIITAWVAIKALKADGEEIEHLQGEVKKQKQNMAYFVQHAEEIAKIKNEEAKVQEEIHNAKTDEEVADIINAIININNARVRK